MRKFFFALNVFILSVVFCYAENSYYIGENVTEMVASQLYDGSSYIFYVQNDNLKALKYDSQGKVESLELFGNEEHISNVSNLKVYDYNCPVFMCVAQENAKPVFMAFIVEQDGQIFSCKEKVKFNIDSMNQIDVSINVNSEIPNFFFVSEGILYGSFIKNNNQIEVNKISRENDCVISYDYKYDKNGSLGGFYQTNSQTVLFYYFNNLLSYYELKKCEIYVSVDNEYKLYCKYFDGIETVIVCFNDGELKKVISKLGKVYFVIKDIESCDSDVCVKEINDSFIFSNKGKEEYILGEQYSLFMNEDNVSLLSKEENSWTYFKSDLKNSGKNIINIPSNSNFIGYYSKEDENDYVFADFVNNKLYFIDCFSFEKNRVLSFENDSLDLTKDTYISNYMDSYIVLSNGENIFYYQLQSDKMESINADFLCYLGRIYGKNRVIIYANGKVYIK